MEQWPIALVSGVAAAFVSGGGVHIIQWLRGRHKDDADAAATIVDTATDVVELLRAELADNKKKQEENAVHIGILEAELKQMRARMSRWEAKFKELGVKPPNGQPHVTGVPV